ncbi:protein Cep89 homolog [Onthophagus taurus]|uniref:protein Cep89 homolog n=1 Tax=Onthophagus taurus TaxID=166361 RepID=UPI0039BE75F6
MQEVPIKPRRKRVDVEVHKAETPSIKTFGGNYPAVYSNRKSKHRIKSEDLNEEEKLNERISKRHLVKENEKLNKEIESLQEKLTSMELYVERKNNKFKEKLNNLQSLNEDLNNENVSLRNLNEEILAQFRACQNELEVARNCQKCEEFNVLVERQKEDITHLKKSNFELIEDVDMLKNVVFRLNVQLERYQQKLHKSNLSFNSHSQNIPKSTPISHENIVDGISILSQTHRGHSHTAVSWGKVNVHTLGPLLDAYEDSINEKDNIIQQYEDQLSIFTEKMRDIIKENENLHKQLIEDDDSSYVLSGEIEKLKEEVQSLKEQNDLLIKKCALKQDKVEEILKCYEQKVEQTKRDYKVLHEEYCKNRTEIAALKEKNKSLLEEKDDFRSERHQYIPLSVHNASVNECKKWYEELKQQYEKEKGKLKEDIETLNKQLLDGAGKISEYKKERDENELKLKAGDKQIKKLETKYLELQHTLKEVELSRSACRKQLHKAMSFARELVSEQETLLKALNQRHQENKAVKRIGSDIATRMDSLKSQLKTVQHEAYLDLSSVEQKLQQKDTIINNLKKQHSLEMDKLKKLITEKEEKSILLKTKSDSSIPLPHYLLFREKSMQKS